MPICKYEILDGGPTGQPIQFATIGQQVYHKWTCDSETTDTFCAVVHTCTVDDGNGDTVQVEMFKLGLRQSNIGLLVFEDFG